MVRPPLATLGLVLSLGRVAMTIRTTSSRRIRAHPRMYTEYEVGIVLVGLAHSTQNSFTAA